MLRGSAIRWGRGAVRIALAVSAAVAADAANAADRGVDGNFDRRTSAHFILYQDVDIDATGGFRGSRRFEQGVLEVLEDAYEFLDRILGFRPKRKIEVIVYDPDIFDREFSRRFRFAAAGFYARVIRVRGDTRVHTGLVRVLNHELVHAALDAAAPSLIFPAWLNEGLAEWFEARTVGKRHLSIHEFELLEWARDNGRLVSLAKLSTPSFGHLGPDAARLAYLQSYGMVEFLARRHGDRKLREFCHDLIRSRNLGRSLSRVYRSDLSTLESRFLEEFRGDGPRD